MSTLHLHTSFSIVYSFAFFASFLRNVCATAAVAIGAQATAACVYRHFSGQNTVTSREKKILQGNQRTTTGQQRTTKNAVREKNTRCLSPLLSHKIFTSSPISLSLSTIIQRIICRCRHRRRRRRLETKSVFWANSWRLSLSTSNLQPDRLRSSRSRAANNRGHSKRGSLSFLALVFVCVFWCRS